jgi:hypothetical protein
MGGYPIILQIYATETCQTANEMCEKAGEVKGGILKYKMLKMMCRFFLNPITTIYASQ